jgi:hypothetical protein
MRFDRGKADWIGGAVAGPVAASELDLDLGLWLTDRRSFAGLSAGGPEPADTEQLRTRGGLDHGVRPRE